MTVEILLALGFEKSKTAPFFNKGKLSVYWCEEDNEFFLNHEYPFDFQVNTVHDLTELSVILNQPGRCHLENLMNSGV